MSLKNLRIRTRSLFYSKTFTYPDEERKRATVKFWRITAGANKAELELIEQDNQIAMYSIPHLKKLIAFLSSEMKMSTSEAVL